LMIAGKKFESDPIQKCDAQYIIANPQKGKLRSGVWILFQFNLASISLCALRLLWIANSFSSCLNRRPNFSGRDGRSMMTKMLIAIGNKPSIKKIHRHASQPCAPFRSWTTPYEIRPLNELASVDVEKKIAPRVAISPYS
jgi:hypothetical protein